MDDYGSFSRIDFSLSLNLTRMVLKQFSLFETDIPIEKQPIFNSCDLSYLDTKTFNISHRKARMNQLRARNKSRVGTVALN